MKKLVLKTIAITLSAVIAFSLLTFGFFALFFPAPLARVFDGIGSYSASVFFLEKQYNKTGDIEDLAELVIKLDKETDSENAESYLSMLVYHQDFEKYCDELDGLDGSKVSTKEYYVGSYASVLVRNGKLETALEVADEFVDLNGYTEYNPYSIIIMENGKQMSNQDLDKITAKITLACVGLSGQELINAMEDCTLAQQLKK